MSTMRKQLLVTAVLSSALLLTACGPVGGPSPSDSDSASAPASETPSAEPSTDPSSAPPVAPAATIVGTCPVGTGYHSIPATYVAFTDDATTPVTISYTVFNADGTVPVVTETVTGPVITRISYPCVDDTSNGMWTLTVTADQARLGCALSFGGQLVDAESQGDGGLGTFTADCTGNPGV